MEIGKEEDEKFQRLEESLWLPKTRFDQSYMNEILADNFIEFGRSGRIYTREEILSAPHQEINISLPLKNMVINRVTDELVLITYRSEVYYDVLEAANRSSLWILSDDRWRLRFHQGTPV